MHTPLEASTTHRQIQNNNKTIAKQSYYPQVTNHKSFGIQGEAHKSQFITT